MMMPTMTNWLGVSRARWQLMAGGAGGGAALAAPLQLHFAAVPVAGTQSAGLFLLLLAVLAACPSPAPRPSIACAA